MSSQEVTLNLARKWRSKTFDEVVGQPLTIKIIRNSLYLGHSFPVYLFSGQRGCGKTSVARILAAAFNCEHLPTFQKNPKQALPCLTCSSCEAMKETRHPDFIEMDAASHTGVDNIRALIESSTFLPVMGRKKIYLIDEAHMLSKSAFNAFLKILEEPPASVVFILATTDPDKIIETVRSRCFQLFFNPLAELDLIDHMARICDKEEIAYDRAGLTLIYQQSQGSVRDALNILERVRFSSDCIDEKTVRHVLGQPSDDALLNLLILLHDEQQGAFLAHVHELGIEHLSIDYLYQRMMTLLQAALYYRYDVALPGVYADLARSASLSQSWLLFVLERLLEKEQLFHRALNKRLAFESILFSCTRGESMRIVESTEHVKKKSEESIQRVVQTPPPVKSAPKDTLWEQFVSKVIALDDPLAISLFQQAQVESYDEAAKVITISLDKKFSFLCSVLDDTQATWRSALCEIYGEQSILKTVMKDFGNKREEQKKDVNAPASTPQPIAKPVISSGMVRADKQKKNSVSSIDISDKEKWKIAHSLLAIVPGKIIQVNEGSHE